ncbi:transcription initiation factor TFIID subunit 11 [Ziziphus jujuba]|uniref:Transcription initiation factor TFIID subunit 11 n=1 Tax=Ziziphus jujuba TaxID=326968 RepID=A0A6P3YZE3_ZIZJJ|nr:transcription initiation factor TFIID subunit 11 [Ziziphus jujuba]XP_015867664.2 transcription initiation factor TFIID subunit 11 [Ziziphus jujuba]XP_015867728.2 transcription initiation factor TFIID subunit 11 [Ziziphus jujuba]XP_015867794.2 transcription initiation factor TFIID subunit 11 [Ziziphus jujuba]XP_015867853.2 transcription initiation factor TFIID subunit 11 [Ziziphus jujuba]XP_015867923.2 transcription initiation factor TFIID subunit 11 [Ziziphus jujuba]XP_015867995.2 transcri
MKQQSKDPFEAAFEEQEDSPPESPAAAGVAEDIQTLQHPAVSNTVVDAQEDDDPLPLSRDHPSSSMATTSAAPMPVSSRTHAPSSVPAPKNKEDDDEEEEENMEVELSKFPSSGDPDKMAKMQAILSQFTEEQMSRYESFRRAGFQKSNMKRLLASISGTQKISVPMTIVVSGIAKMFVGELVETARMVMAERKESGPIRPCHIREAYRRLKLEGKVPKRSVPRLFR